MKRLLIAIIVLALGWAGYWFVASQGVKSGFAGWFQDRRDQGWVAEYADLTVAGFPNRVDTTFTGLVLADPKSGWAWEAPFFQLLTLSYRPSHIIAVWPNQQLLATPDQKIDITSAQLQASVVLDAGEALPLNRANLVAETLTLQTRDGQSTTMTALRAAIQTVEDTPNTYRFAIEAEDFAPPMAFRDLGSAADRLPRTFDALRAQVSVTFDDRWDRAAVERRRPRPTRIDLPLAEARWGDLELWLAGQADVDDLGRMNGEITIKARNWRDIIDMAVQSGRLSETLGKQMTEALGMLSRLAGNPNTLDVPLTLRKGTAWLGPVPVATLPRLVLR
ncbi:DUF2125 domain-containing protein [Thalassovita sp.]|uniref:DUF2125 domain-containing protein n=1 Tax=Thalassovita sp. TaxID=1979401 RepID=UPI0029DE660E|nr:DUF2125 domain-containing protein [Thalassovita sp.]